MFLILSVARRIVNSYKADSLRFIPVEDFQIIYQKRENSLISFLPRDVINKSKLIFCVDDNVFMPERVADFALMHGFRPIDLGFVGMALDENRSNNFKVWDKNPQLAIR